jgi:23S rRNA pseudouridine1911/1915/1917 synthase
VAEAPSVLQETETFLVVAKPVGWHTVRGATASEPEGHGVVESWLARRFPELAALPECGLVHRLDRDTTGCLVVARTPGAHAELTRHFRAGERVRKHYLARVRPGIDARGAATLYFTSRYKSSARVTVARTGAARHEGRFRWRVVARDATRGDLVELELLGPGRRHELRAGCAFLGHPLVGDALYGGAPADAPQLHAWRVVIDGLTVEAPAPPWARASF